MPPVIKKTILIDWHEPNFKVEQYVKSDAKDSKDGFLLLRAMDLDVKTVQTTVQHTLDTLKNLPVENPPGGEDIYGFDTSISISAPGFAWENRANDGCAIRPSTIKPNPQQKLQFKALIDHLTQLGDQAQTIVPQ